MPKNALIWIASILASQAFSQTTGIGGSLSGKVVSSTGQFVSGAVVTASRTSTVPWASSRATTGSDGSFAFSSLPQGTTNSAFKYWRAVIRIPAVGR